MTVGTGQSDHLPQSTLISLNHDFLLCHMYFRYQSCLGPQPIHCLHEKHNRLQQSRKAVGCVINLYTHQRMNKIAAGHLSFRVYCAAANDVLVGSALSHFGHIQCCDPKSITPQLVQLIARHISQLRRRSDTSQLLPMLYRAAILHYKSDQDLRLPPTCHFAPAETKIKLIVVILGHAAPTIFASANHWTALT